MAELSISEILAKNLAESLSGMSPEKMATLVAIATASQKLSVTVQDMLDRINERWYKALESMKARRIKPTSGEWIMQEKVYIRGCTAQLTFDENVLQEVANMLKKINS